MKNKIGIITFHKALNYGAVLQTYALQNFLKINNFDNEIIDYNSKYIEKCYKPFFISNGKVINSIVRGLLFGANINKKQKNFNDFINENLVLSDEKYETKNILGIDNKYQYVITGSDQVWSPVSAGFDVAYFLPSIKENYKFSYAASIGEKSLSDELIKEYQKRLSGYNYISVREESAKELIKKIDDKKEVFVHVDPTLLLNKHSWETLASEKTESEPYILIFNVEKPINDIEFAKKLAKRENLKVVYINDRTIKKDKDIKYYEAPSPSVFLSLFKNASAVVTNSFHGTVFSIIFQKDLYVELDNKKKFNVRAQALLKMLGVENRIIKSEDLFDETTAIDFEKIDDILKEKRKESLDYFNNIFSKNNIPELFKGKENCCGCAACYCVCPVSAISMIEDMEGFHYPSIDKNKCINCKKCISVCDFKKAQTAKA